ncbi:MAG: C40 family peptidase [candidate division Zixibacteria bacterium]|jgi:hypothetical protein|nr:C40 family peptidase [candidate division Zixibacteria bacterium]
MLIWAGFVAIIDLMMMTHKVNRPVADVRRKPDSRSERLNQLLFNEIVTGLGAKGDYVRIKGADRYTGWVRKDHLSPGSATSHSYLVDVPIATLIDEATGRFVGKLSFGTEITPLEKSESFARTDFCGKPAWISLGCIRRRTRQKPAWKTVQSYLQNLIGTPYLWGGRSGFGFDCSGLVQLVYNSCGHDLPRDSVDQRRRGRKISMKHLKPGDLIFSPGHVCIYYGSGQIIHSSERAGGVYIENLLPDLPDSRTDIYEKIQVVKRVI